MQTVAVNSCAPFMRSQENIALTTDRSVAARAGPRMQALLGLRAWNGIGRVGTSTELDGTETGLPLMSTDDGAASSRAAASSGGSVEPRAGLPSPTADPAQLRADIQEFGWCMISSALAPAEIEALTTRITEQAAAEAAEGVGISTEDGRQQVVSLVNKGKNFVQLLLQKRVNELIQLVIGEEFQLSATLAEIAQQPADGGAAETGGLQTLQWWLPQPINRSSIAPQVRPGSMTLDKAYAGLNASESADVVAPAVTLAAHWALSDLDAETAPTAVPRSHLSGKHPTADEAAAGGVQAGAVPLSCPAGTCIVTDGRLWRADGAVPSAAPRISVQYKFLGPQFRAPLSPSPVQIILLTDAGCGHRCGGEQPDHDQARAAAGARPGRQIRPRIPAVEQLRL